jgi:pimeloyl-ACP methyl ester carboxylesterase
MFGRTISLGARVLLLLFPLAAALDPAVAHGRQSGDFAGLVDVGGGREMYLECRGIGSSTVVLVAGLRGSAEDWNIAEKPGPRVFPEVAKFTRVCAYDRPGTPVGEKPSRSDPVPQPTTAGTAVADLHALLTAAGEAGPYVLVAHSYGGLIGRLYASTYPDDVSGLVLVDALSEGLKDAETPEQWAIQRKLIEGDVRDGVAQYPALETIDVDRSFDEMRAASPLRQLPLIVLSADRSWGPQVPSMIAAGTLPADVPQNFGYVVDAAQKQAQERLAKLVPNARHTTNTNSGHEIHKEQPQLVIDAIRQVVDAVRDLTSWRRSERMTAPSGKSPPARMGAPGAAGSGEFAGLVDIGGARKLYLECNGTGSPVVILEAGLRNRADIWSVKPETGEAVFPTVANFTRVCAYDRPGTTLGTDQLSRSDAVPMPRTAEDAVADLHALLQAAAIPAPYVLVGHSTGGLIIRLYASTYPKQVAGLVLVDAISEVLQTAMTPEHWAAYDRLLLVDPPKELTHYKDLETIDFDASFDQLRGAAKRTPLAAVPLIVISKSRPFELPPGLPTWLPATLERAWTVSQQQLAQLLPDAPHTIATSSSHYVQIEQPQLVIDSIRRVVDAVRGGSRRLGR